MQNPEEKLRILALDVAFTHTGVVILEYKKQNWTPVYTECIVTKPEAKRRHTYETDDKVRRVRIISESLNRIINQWQPQLIAAELPISGGKSAKAHTSMGMAIAVVTCAASLLNKPLRNYNWDDIKIKLTGKRSASKREIQEAVVRRWPDLGNKYRSERSCTGYTGNFEHIADAVGAGMCAVDSETIQTLIQFRGEE